VRAPFHPLQLADRPGGGVGQLLWWVNYLLKQSVPTHRPISFRLPIPRADRGDLGLWSKASRPVLSPTPLEPEGSARGRVTNFVGHRPIKNS